MTQCERSPGFRMFCRMQMVACFPQMMTQRVPSVGLRDFIACAVSQTQYVNCDYWLLIIQYLNILSTIISPSLYQHKSIFCRNHTLNRDKQRYSRLQCSPVQCSVLLSPGDTVWGRGMWGLGSLVSGESGEACSSHPWQDPFRWEAIGHSDSDNESLTN